MTPNFGIQRTRREASLSGLAGVESLVFSFEGSEGGPGITSAKDASRFDRPGVVALSKRDVRHALTQPRA